MPNKKRYMNDELVIAAFLRYYKVPDICRETGLSKNTVYRYRNDPGFQAKLKEMKGEIIHATINRMSENMMRNFDTLQGIIDNPDTMPQIKVNAIQLYATQLRDWTTTEDIMRQLEEIRGALKGDFGTNKGVL